MSTNAQDPQQPPTLDLAQLREITSAVPQETWSALGTGTAGGDHWYICNDGEAIASVASQDGINEETREPLARHIAAYDPPTALALLDRAEYLQAQTQRNYRDWQIANARAEAAEAKLAAVMRHCGQAEWMKDGDGDEWLALAVGPLKELLNSKGEVQS